MHNNNERLVKVLEHASEHSDFYKRRIREYGITNPIDITQWPILSRETLQAEKYAFLSEKYHGKSFNDLLIKKSSGTSGVPISVYWDRSDFYNSTMPSWRLRKKFYSITPLSRQANFNIQLFDDAVAKKDLICHEEKNIISFNKANLQNNYLQLYQRIKQFNPEWMYTTPYILERLLEIMKQYDLEPPEKLKYIECSGEILFDELKKTVNNMYKIIVANMYGAEETNGIALECPYGNMHIMEDNVFVECLSNNRFSLVGQGEAIVTSLHNFAMPLIRYNLNDEIIIENASLCPCGNTHRIIRTVSGRKNEYYTFNGFKISGYNLFESINILNNLMNNPIERFYCVYESKKQKLIIYLRIKTGFLLQKDIINNRLLSILNNRNICAREIIILNDSIWENRDAKNKQRILYIQ